MSRALVAAVAPGFGFGIIREDRSRRVLGEDRSRRVLGEDRSRRIIGEDRSRRARPRPVRTARAHARDDAPGATVEENSGDTHRDTVPASSSRRGVLFTGLVCGCGCLSPARAAVRLVEPDVALSDAFDVERDARRDAAFAKGMATMMDGFERAVASRKRRLFTELLSSYDGVDEMSVCEIGAGSAPNAEYYARCRRDAGPKSVDVVAVDPNDSMRAFAEENVRRFASVGDRPIRARFVHGVGEALPLADASVDAVVSTLTLCSVADQAQTLSEIRRVLRPGGKFVFLEHVLSETDPKFARLQVTLTPMQRSVADGCNLDRRTLKNIQDSGLFTRVDAEYYELDGFWVIAPQVCGIAEA